MSAETLHPALRRAPSVQDYSHMNDQVRRAAVRLLAAEKAAIDARTARLNAARARAEEVAKEWGATTRAQAAEHAALIAEAFGDAPHVTAARRALLIEALRSAP